jgi:hypothetical protein
MEAQPQQIKHSQERSELSGAEEETQRDGAAAMRAVRRTPPARGDGAGWWMARVDLPCPPSRGKTPLQQPVLRAEEAKGVATPVEMEPGSSLPEGLAAQRDVVVRRRLPSAFLTGCGPRSQVHAGGGGRRRACPKGARAGARDGGLRVNGRREPHLALCTRRVHIIEANGLSYRLRESTARLKKRRAARRKKT